MKYDLTEATMIHADPNLIVSQMGSDVVMLSIEQGNYYGLNPVAARIWQLIGQDTSIGTICEQLKSEFEVAPEECASAVYAFINRLLDERLVEIKANAVSEQEGSHTSQ